MTKLEHYAQLLYARKQRALSEISKLEAKGYIVSEWAKTWAASRTPTKISKRTLDRAPTIQYVRRQARYGVTSINKESQTIDLATPAKTDISYNAMDRYEKGDGKTLARELTKAIKGYKSYAKTSEDLSRKVLELVLALTPGHYPKPGDNNNYYTIDNNYNPKNPTSLVDHLTFKDLPNTDMVAANIQRILEQPYTSRDLHQKYLEDASARGYQTLMRDIFDPSGTMDPTDLDSRIEYFRSLLNTSHMWRVCGAGWLPSEQVKANYATLAKSLMRADRVDVDASRTNDIITAIENEESFDVVLAMVESAISDALRKSD
jgi:hypothetical protein